MLIQKLFMRVCARAGMRVRGDGNFFYLCATSYGNIDCYCTSTQNVIKIKSTTLLNFEDFEKPKLQFSRQIPIYTLSPYATLEMRQLQSSSASVIACMQFLRCMCQYEGSKDGHSAALIEMSRKTLQNVQLTCCFAAQLFSLLVEVEMVV